MLILVKGPPLVVVKASLSISHLDVRSKCINISPRPVRIHVGEAHGVTSTMPPPNKWLLNLLMESIVSTLC